MAAALIKLPTEKQLQSCDFQNLVWSSKHCKLTISWQPLSKKHVGCKHRQSYNKRAPKDNKNNLWWLGLKTGIFIFGLITWFLVRYKITSIFESCIHFGHFLVELTRGNDHWMSILYRTVLKNLIEVDIQCEFRHWKMLMFLFVFLWCCKLTGNPAFFHYGRKHLHKGVV